MSKRLLSERVRRGDQMFKALSTETDRGKACVGDAMLDELFKEMFGRRLVEDRETKDLFAPGRPLGSHGTRLRLAYLLGWIGSETYQDCKTIHAIRNKMAHSLDVDSFAHRDVRDLVGNLKGPQSTIDVMTRPSQALKKVRTYRPADIVLLAVSIVMLRCWDSMNRAKRQRPGKDAPMFTGPRQIAAYMTDPKVPVVPV